MGRWLVYELFQVALWAAFLLHTLGSLRSALGGGGRIGAGAPVGQGHPAAPLRGRGAGRPFQPVGHRCRMRVMPVLLPDRPVVPAEAPRPKAHGKRRVQVAVVSDVHLGTYGCHARELLRYLKSIRPQVLVLNGDIVDIWQFSKNYWPPAHMRVVRYLAGLAAKGVKIHYLTGNHDELLRKFAGLKLGNFRLDNKLVLDLPHGRTWLFHGDVFDVTMRHSRWLAKLGGQGYDLLILLNRFVNYVLAKFGRPRVALSKLVKERVKTAVAAVSNFEATAAAIAADEGYRYVACGHIHQPEIKPLTTERGEVIYLNSGDWVENLTALEYTAEAGWQLYYYNDDPAMQQTAEADAADAAEELADTDPAKLLAGLLAEFKIR